MGIVDTCGVDFVVFQMMGSAKMWWRDYILTIPAGLHTLTCDKFSRLFLEKFLPITLREDYGRQFEHLQQGNMIVTQYESRFVDLVRHALILLPTERKRLRRFIDRLTHPIMLQMAKETRGEIPFQTATNVTRRIEMVLAQERRQGSNKRPRHFGGFNGASCGGIHGSSESTVFVQVKGSQFEAEEVVGAVDRL
ncbi:uncharacterized protein [Nicotiana tomentosiformis]|uniref:uncharacterized protein n=1 Tax=Nicotiana tomentosiformis TaxID=4098 RepID=UPI00388CE33E